MSYVDIAELFDGPGPEIPSEHEWADSDAILAEFDIEPISRRNTYNAPDGPGYPGNRAYLRSQMRRRLVKAGHVVSYRDGEGKKALMSGMAS